VTATSACSSPTPQGNGAKTASTTGDGSNALSASEKLVLQVRIGYLSTKNFVNPESTILDEQFKAIDWSTAESVSVLLTRTAGGNSESMSIHRVAANQPITISWVCMENGKKVVKDGPSLSAEEGLPLLLAFHRNDPNIQSMTQWTIRRLEFKGPQDYPEGNPNLRKQQ
jgi:hypothetical protein